MWGDVAPHFNYGSGSAQCIPRSWKFFGKNFCGKCIVVRVLPSDESAYYLTSNHLTLINVKTFIVTVVV